MTKVFKKSQKKTYFGAILGPFLPKFTYKKGLSVFKYSNYLPSRSKSEKTKDPLLRKMPNWRTERWTDGRTEGRMDGRTDRQKTVIFLGPSVTGVQCVFPSGQFLINYEETIWHK